ncbi:hypothetical protein D3C86_503130 [compost metagenome]
MQHEEGFTLPTMLIRLMAIFAISISATDGASAAELRAPESAVAGMQAQNWESRLVTPEDLLDYIVAHPDKASLTAFSVDNPQSGIFHRADAPQPLASTVKILVLYEYAHQVAEGRLRADERVALDEVFAYLVGRDGGAAMKAYEDWKKRGVLDTSNRLPLSEVVHAMIRWSDNASTDYLIERLGREHLEKAPSRLGMNHDEPPFPITGSTLMSYNHTMKGNPQERLNRYEAFSRKDLANEAHRWALRLRQESGFRDNEIRWLKGGGWALSYDQQQRFFRVANPRGTTRGYADLMAKVYQARLPKAVVNLMKPYLEWPMEFEGNQKAFDTYGTKGGSLPGMLTGASYFMLKGRPVAFVSALFLQDLPAPIYESLSKSFLQQHFEIKLHADSAFFERVRQTLAGLPSSSKE